MLFHIRFEFHVLNVDWACDDWLHIFKHLKRHLINFPKWKRKVVNFEIPSIQWISLIFKSISGSRITQHFSKSTRVVCSWLIPFNIGNVFFFSSAVNFRTIQAMETVISFHLYLIFAHWTLIHKFLQLSLILPELISHR